MSENEAPLMGQQTFDEGEVIFTDGDHGDCAFVVETGVVEISKDAEGHKVVLGVIRDGGMFGEMALVDNAPRMATATAKEACECVVIRKEEFQKSLMVASPFVTLLVHMLLKNVRSISDQFIDYISETDRKLKD